MEIKKTINNILQLLYGIFSGITVIVLFFVCAFLLKVFVKKDKPPKTGKTKSEKVVINEDSTNQGIHKYYLSHQSWTDFNGKQHELPFKVGYQNVLRSAKNRKDLRLFYNGDHIRYWGTFYRNLADHDQPLVEELARTFFDYQKGKNMSRLEFAELMITAIQDIPYTLILSRACSPEDRKPCVGNVKSGLYAPAEFVANLSGDCDTRTVLLFTLLSRFKYDVAILNSVFYKHSILGLHINSTGKYKTYKRRKYYFVETTTRRNPIGYLHPEYSETNYWDVVLTN